MSSFPKNIYRQEGETLKCITVNDEKAEKSASLEGWGPHPSTVKEKQSDPAPSPTRGPAPDPNQPETNKQAAARIFKGGSRSGKYEPQRPPNRGR